MTSNKILALSLLQRSDSIILCSCLNPVIPATEKKKWALQIVVSVHFYQ